MTTKMRPFGETISLEEARARIDAAVRPIDRTERVVLADAVCSGRAWEGRHREVPPIPIDAPKHGVPNAHACALGWKSSRRMVGRSDN